MRLGGVPVEMMPEADLRRLIAVIPQEAYVFAGSLRENLTYPVADADDMQLVEAARASGLDRVVQRLGGFDALVGTGGAQLSSGEKQLVALARVYLSPRGSSCSTKPPRSWTR